MGVYIAQSDVEEQFGETNVQIWSDLDGSGSTDVAVVARAILYAETRVENLFRNGRYAIPFVFTSGSTDAVVTNWMSVFAGVWLYRNRGIRDEDAGERMRVLEEGEDGNGGIKGEMRDYLAGIAILPAASIEPQPDSPVVIFG